MNKIEQAKQVLREAGYFTDNLWSVKDVMDNYKCNEEQAQEILSKALTNDATMEQIWLAIAIEADILGFEKIEEEIFGTREDFILWLEETYFVDPHIEFLVETHFDSSKSFQENLSEIINLIVK